MLKRVLACVLGELKVIIYLIMAWEAFCYIAAEVFNSKVYPSAGFFFQKDPPLWSDLLFYLRNK